MANLLSWLGGAAKRVENTVNNDVVQPINRDVVQPVLGRPAPGAQPNVLANARYGIQAGAQNLVNADRTILNIANRNIVQPQLRIANIIPNEAKFGFAQALHQPNAPQYLRAAGQGVQTAEGIPRGIAQNATRFGMSTADALGANVPTLRPTNAAEKFVLGKAPIQTYRAEANQQGIPQALLTAGGDALGLATLKGGIEKGLAPSDLATSTVKTSRASVGTPAKQQVFFRKDGGLPSVAINKYNPNPSAVSKFVDKATANLKNERGSIQLPGSAKKEPIPVAPAKLEQNLPSTASVTPGPGQGLRAGVGRINQATQANLPESIYTKRPQAVLQANSDALVSKGLDAATGKVQKALAQTPGRLTDQQLSDAYAVAQKHIDTGNTTLGNDILTKTLAHDTKTAQALAARGMLTKQSPQGIRKMVLSAFDRAKVPYEGDLKTKVESALTDVGKTQAGTPERELAVRKLANTASNALPRGPIRATAEFWRALLISGPQTAVKVAISQPISALQAYGAEQVGSIADAAHSLATGAPRTLGFTPFKGIGSGLKTGLSDAVTKVKTGLDAPGSGGYTRSLEDQLKSGTHKTPVENAIFNVHSAVAKTPHNVIRNNTLASLGKAEAINQGLKGAERSAFIDNYIKNPPAEAYQHALQAGESAVNQQHTFLGDQASKLQNAGGKNGGPGPGIIVAPITRAPGAIATNALYDYSGVKLAKDAIYNGLIKHGTTPNLSRTIAEDFGKAVVGAGGVTGLGAVLGATGNITPAKFSNAKDAALAKAQGKPAGSIRIPGLNKWISLNALGPVGIELAGGGGVGTGYKESGVGGAIAQGAGAAGQEIAQQPYLQGIAGVGNVLNNPKQYAKSFVNNTVGSVIPAFASQTASGIDPNQRQINYSSLSDVLKSRIPGVRQSIPAAPDVLGGRNVGANPSGTIGGGILGTLDALKPSQPKGTSDPVTQELSRLNIALPSADSPSVALPKRDQVVNGKKITLNDQQLAQYTGQSGQLINQGVASLIQTPEYKAATDTAKAAAVNDVISKARDLTKQDLASGAAGAPTPTAVLTRTAQLKAAKDSFSRSGSNIQLVGDTVLTKDAAGTILATPKIKYDYNIGTATLTQQKNAGDLTGYLTTAQKQLDNINQQLQDPSTSPLERLTLQNDATALQKSASKYLGYGGFTKPKRAASRTGSTAGFKTAKLASTKTPKITGIKVAKPKAFKAPTTRKLSVSSLPKISSSKRKSVV